MNRAQRIGGSMRIEPDPIGLRAVDDRHPIVQRTHQLVGRRCQDGTGLDLLALRIVPPLPQSGQGERSAVAWPDEVRLLSTGPDFLPFVEPGRWDEAATLLDGRAEGRLVGNCFRPRVEELVADGRIGRPRWNETPAEQGRFSPCRRRPDGGYKLGGGDVVAGVERGRLGQLEAFGQFVSGSKQVEAARCGRFDPDSPDATCASIYRTSRR